MDLLHNSPWDVPAVAVQHLAANDFGSWDGERIGRVADLCGLRRAADPRRKYVEVDCEGQAFTAAHAGRVAAQAQRLREALARVVEGSALRGAGPFVLGLFPGKQLLTVDPSLAGAFDIVQAPFYVGRYSTAERWRAESEAKASHAAGLGVAVVGHVSPRRNGYRAIPVLGWPDPLEPVFFAETVNFVRARCQGRLMWGKRGDPLTDPDPYVAVFAAQA